MKLNKSKKAFILLSTYLVFLFVPKIKNNKKDITYNSEYTYHSQIPYATYSNGNVYIADSETIENIFQDNNDVFIIDTRYENNSDIGICNSYKVTSNKEQREIIDIILQYEKTYPSNWNRTYESMMNEWDAHNICYYLGINRTSTHEVNFDNYDQDKYDSKVLTFFLNN